MEILFLRLHYEQLVSFYAMKFFFIIAGFYCLIFLGCDNQPKAIQKTLHEAKEKQLYFSSVKWLDSAKVEMAIDRTLSYKKEIDADSALAIDYTGFEGEHTFLPLNDKGQWINKIHKVRKLSSSQEKYVAAVISDKRSYANPLIVACYQPRHGIVYFENGKVIGQTAICLGCARLESTLETGDPKREGLFNEKARQRLNKLCKDLAFSECRE